MATQLAPRSGSVARTLDSVPETASSNQLAGGFHDTSGSALFNVEVAIGRGVTIFDATTGGLGGCPFAPGCESRMATFLAWLTQLMSAADVAGWRSPPVRPGPEVVENREIAVCSRGSAAAPLPVSRCTRPAEVSRRRDSRPPMKTRFVTDSTAHGVFCRCRVRGGSNRPAESA